jgi:hypothetical protein
LFAETLQALFRWTGNPVLAIEFLVIGAYALLATAEAVYSRVCRKGLYNGGETALNRASSVSTYCGPQ